MKLTRSQFWSLFLAITLNVICIKMMLIPSYRSTDFDVHRNWLAITFSLPLKDWYFEKTSIWTLDYPPFFAYFEYVLAQIVCYLNLDQEMLKVENVDYSSIHTIYFQRFSVIMTDFVFYLSTFAILKYLWANHTSNHSTYDNDSDHGNSNESMKIKMKEMRQEYNVYSLYTLVIANGGLLLVDHIHFQYNGLLMGLLLICMIQVQTNNGSSSKISINSKRYYLLVVSAASLFLMKHLFLPLGLVFVVYIIQNIHMDLKQANLYSGRGKSGESGESWNSVRCIYTWSYTLATLACTGISIFLLALLPFYISSSATKYATISIGASAGVDRDFLSILVQIVSRLFPISRGLLHTYWAPNIWALYAFVDMIACRINGGSGNGNGSSMTSFTSGITNEFTPGTLPVVSSSLCILLVLLSLLIVLVPIVRSNNRCSGIGLIRLTLYSTLSTFMLGYHVHEKAIIPPAILSTILCYQSTSDASLCFQILLVCVHCQLPLLPYISEVHVKLLVTAVSYSLTWICCMPKISSGSSSSSSSSSTSSKNVFGIVLLSHVVVTVLREVIYPWCANGMFGEVILTYANHYQFLPLLITSVFNAFCLLPCWYQSYCLAISNK